MGKFKEKLYRFMYGRYGTDQLYNFLMILFFIFWGVELVVLAIIPEGQLQGIMSIVFGLITTSIIVWMTYRTMSRNIYKRRRENEAYLKAQRAAKRFFSLNTASGTKSRNVDDAQHIFRDCTKCGSVLRLPRREGRHKVNCPRCHNSFYVKAKKYKAPRF